MKKIAVYLIFAGLLLSFPLLSRAQAPENSAGAAVLIHKDTGRILYEKNAHERRLIASTTKIMTALVVLENCQPWEKVEVLAEHAAVEGSSMYLVPGGDYTVEELLYGMLLASGNDAAAALACHCGGDISGFADMMNAAAENMGLQNTSFENPHGLDGEEQYSSAYDLALITQKALDNQLFARIVATKSYTLGEQTYVNHNKLLWNLEGCLGVKTGYTMAAGRTLVSCCERQGLELICVTLSDGDDWQDHTALYDWAFSAFEYRSFAPIGELCRIPVISGENDSVGVRVRASEAILCKTGADLELELELPRFVYAGIIEGQYAGAAKVYSQGDLLRVFELEYSETVPVAEGLPLSPWDRFLRAWYMANKFALVLGSGQ